MRTTDIKRTAQLQPNPTKIKPHSAEPMKHHETPGLRHTNSPVTPQFRKSARLAQLAVEAYVDKFGGPNDVVKPYQEEASRSMVLAEEGASNAGDNKVLANLLRYYDLAIQLDMSFHYSSNADE